MSAWGAPGGPLSPLIFILAIDLLQAAVNDAFQMGQLRLLIRTPNSDYSRVQYADDTILVLPTEVDQILKVKKILQDYASSVGLHINFSKSTLVPINISDDLAKELASALQYSLGTMSFTYLGLPMGTTRPFVQDLMPMVTSVERRLSSATSLLDYGSKLTLVNSVITSLSVYTMCSILVPAKIIDHIDKLRRRWIWAKKDDSGTKINSLAAWDLICRPKNRGGLGVINLKV